MKRFLPSLTAAAGLWSAAHCDAQVLLSFLSGESGAVYAEDFDTLANSGTSNDWTDNSTLLGWYAGGNFGGNYRAGTGSGTTGDIYSFGAASNIERALGSLVSGTTETLAYGVRLKNDMGMPLFNISVSYTGEQWRKSNAAATHSLEFSYRVSSSSITDVAPTTAPDGSTWIAVTSLNFTGPQSGGTASALDGNDAANRLARSATLGGITLNDGEELFLRWRDLDDTGNDHGLAIDDLTVEFFITPIPEPHEYAVVAGLGLVGFALWHRHRRAAKAA